MGIESGGDGPGNSWISSSHIRTDDLKTTFDFYGTSLSSEIEWPRLWLRCVRYRIKTSPNTKQRQFKHQQYLSKTSTMLHDSPIQKSRQEFHGYIMTIDRLNELCIHPTSALRASKMADLSEMAALETVYRLIYTIRNQNKMYKIMTNTARKNSTICSKCA